MILEIQEPSKVSSAPTPMGDEKLLRMADIVGLRFAGYQRMGRGYRMHFLRGVVGDVQHYHTARHQLRHFVSEEVKKMKP